MFHTLRYVSHGSTRRFWRWAEVEGRRTSALTDLTSDFMGSSSCNCYKLEHRSLWGRRESLGTFQTLGKPKRNSAISRYWGEDPDVVPACAVATLMPSNIKAKPAADIVAAPVRESLPSLTATTHPGINPLVVPAVDLLCTISVVSEPWQ